MGTRKVLRVAGWRNQQLVPRPRVRQPPDRRDRHVRRMATTWTPDLCERRSSSSATPGRSTRTSHSSCISPRRPGTRRTRRRRVDRQVQGPLRQRIRGDPGTHPRAADRDWGFFPKAPNCRAINPHGEPSRTGPDGQPWPILDTVRPWNSLNDDEKRLLREWPRFSPATSHIGITSIGRVIDYLEESGQLDNTLIVVDLRQRCERRGRAERRVQRVALLQRHPQRPRPRPWRTSTNSAADLLQPLLHRVGVGARHAFPILEALGRRRGWGRGHVFRVLARTGFGSSQVAPAVRPRGRRRADDLRTARHRPASMLKGYTQSPIEGESFANSLTDPDGAGQARPSSTRCWASGRSTTTGGWPRLCIHRCRVGERSRKDEWELFHLDTDRAQAHDVASDHPDRVEVMKGLWFYYAGQYNGLPLDDRSALEQVLAERPRGGPVASAMRFYPHMADVPESDGTTDQRALVHHRVRSREWTRPTPRACCMRTAASTGGHSLYVKDRRLTYVFNWVGRREVRAWLGVD